MLAFYSKLLLVALYCNLIGFPTSINENSHPLHVSTTEINFNSKVKSLEISCRIFTDDFENILAKAFKAKTDLTKPALHKEMDELVKKYLNAHLKYQVNGKAVSANYIGFEIDHEATNVYLEIENIVALERISITNSILYDLFDDQMNILHVERLGIRKSARNNFPSTGLSVTFN